MTTDAIIRNALHPWLKTAHHSGGALIIDELGIYNGSSRIDVAVIDDDIHGFEIKSDRDSLSRLPMQAMLANYVVDQMTIVCGNRRSATIHEHIPAWWGIIVASCGDGVHFHHQRAPRKNPGQVPVHLARLLWRDEMLDELKCAGLDRGFRGKTKEQLAQRIAEHVDLPALRAIVCHRLKSRDWLALRTKTPPDARERV